MSQFLPKAAVTGIGSLPQRDPEEACAFVARYAPSVPFWPQLPQRSPLEGLGGQFAGGLPGIEENSATVPLRNPALSEALEDFYGRYLSGDPDSFNIGPEHAAGLYALEKELSGMSELLAVKGQVTGPVSFGLQLVDEQKRFLLYDDLYRDVLVKQLQMKARWLEGHLQGISAGRVPTIIFFDEPLLYTYGSAYFNVARELVVGTIVEAMAGLSSLTGVHACQNCDWSLIFEVAPDIISFDAYSYLDQFLLYPEQLREFLGRGGILAWGIVPTTDEAYLRVSAEDLLLRLITGFERIDELGVATSEMVARSLVTPACGVGTLPLEHAHRVFSLAVEVSDRLRREL